MNQAIDLRSDTVTRPTPEMREAMFRADVGDDVYREDPTVNRLEERAAEITGKEAALLVPTGTMGNTIAVKVHTKHGQEVICDSRSHLMNYELAMMAWFAGCFPRTISTADGVLTWDEIRREIRAAGPQTAPTALIAVENTHNMAGGSVYSMEGLREISEGAHDLGIPVHMDGARIFNAATSLRVSVREIAKHADTVMFCLSKGLGAPVGSLLAGPAALIDEGRLLRKRLGGGMRQAGVLAAAGLISLEIMTQRLQEDHDKAQLLARGLSEIPGIRVAPAPTNIVIADISGTGIAGAGMSQMLLERGVLANNPGPYTMRLVTHYDVSAGECGHAVDVIREIAASGPSAHSPTSQVFVSKY